MLGPQYRPNERTIHGITRREITTLADRWAARARVARIEGARGAAQVAEQVSVYLYEEAVCARRERTHYARAAAAVLALVLVACAIVGAVALVGDL